MFIEFKVEPIFTGRFNLKASGRTLSFTETKSQIQFSFITLLGQHPLNMVIKSKHVFFAFKETSKQQC